MGVSLFFIYLFRFYERVKLLTQVLRACQLMYVSTLGLLFKGLFLALHLNIAFLRERKCDSEQITAPKSRTHSTLGFVSDGCFLVLYLFISFLRESKVTYASTPSLPTHVRKYIRVVILGVLSRYASIYRIFYKCTHSTLGLLFKWLFLAFIHKKNHRPKPMEFLSFLLSKY